MSKTKETSLLSDFVYKSLRKRIILATVIISVVLASIVYLTNYRQIDTSVADIARDRAERFNLVFDNLLNDPANLDPDAIRNALIKFSNTHTQNHIGEFIYVTIFDKNANAITQMAEADAEAMIEITEISKSNNNRLKSTTTTYLQSFQIDNRYHVYIQVPLWNSNGNISAIVEGVFRVSDEAINTIWTKTFLTILFAIGDCDDYCDNTLSCHYPTYQKACQVF